MRRAGVLLVCEEIKRSKMKGFYILAVVACVVGCTMPFSRPVPTESEYKQRFLTLLQAEQINTLRFSYHGAVGGEAAIARFTVDANSISQIRANAQREDVYRPEDEDVARELRRKIAMCAHAGRIPEWYDFPFEKSLAIFIDSAEDIGKNPSYLCEWYVDEDRGVVYVVMIEG